MAVTRYIPSQRPEARRPDLEPNPLAPPYLLGDVWRDYLWTHCKRKGQDVRRVGYVAKAWLRVMGTDAEVATWKRRDVQVYEDVRQTEGAKGSTIRREMTLMLAALNHARKWEKVDRVPFFQMPDATPGKRRPMTLEEYQRLMKSPMLRRVRMFYILAYWTGHRSRAIETLKWDRVNLDAGTIDFNEPGARLTSKRRVDGFPISEELLRRLTSAKEYADKFMPNDPYVIGLGPRGKCSTTYHACKLALRAVGIDEIGLCRHTMRKTFVTERVKAGMNPEKVAALIADNVQTMRRSYLQMLTEDLRSTVNMTVQ